MGSLVGGRLVELDLVWRVEKFSCTGSGIVAVVMCDAFIIYDCSMTHLCFSLLSCVYNYYQINNEMILEK